MSRSVKSRTAHQRAVHVLLHDRLETSLRALGAADGALRVMESVLPLPTGGVTRPVRVSDVYALERCVARIERLIQTHGLSPAKAIDLAIAFQQLPDQQLVDNDMLREAARHLDSDDECLTSFAVDQVLKARVTAYALRLAPHDDSKRASADAARRDAGEMVLTLPTGLLAQPPLARTASSIDRKHGPRAEPDAPVASEFEGRPPQPYAQRAARLFELAHEIRAIPPGPEAAQDLRDYYALYVPLAGSFTAAELFDDDQRLRLEGFIQEVQPLITQSASTWSSITPRERKQVVATLCSAFHQQFESRALNLAFTREAPPATISADGATATLGLMQDERVWRQFDQLVHQLIYALTLGYQHQLAQQVTQAGFAARSPQDKALPRIMRALTQVPVTRAVLKKPPLGYRLAAARAAEQASATHHHANLLADRVAALAYRAMRTA